MIKKYLATFSLFGLISSIATASPPFYSRPIDSFKPAETLKPGQIRFRVSVTANEKMPDARVRLGALIFCSDTACYRPETPDYVNLSNTKNGTSTVIADAILPNDVIQSIYFETVAGTKTIGGEIALKNPLNLNDGYPAGELLLVLDKILDGKNIKYHPTASSGILFNESFQSIYYNPQFPVSTDLRLGSHLEIPAHALDNSQILLVAVDDVGSAFPSVDIYPEVNFRKPAKFTGHVIVREGLGGQLTTTPPVTSLPRAGASSLPPQPLPSSATVELKIDRTGVFNLNDVNYLGSHSKINEETTGTQGSDCISLLTSPANKQIITNSLATQGAAYLDWCTNIEPHIHIALVNLSDKRIRYELPLARTDADNKGNFYLYLRPLSQWTSNSLIGLNGFTWSGDEGTALNQLALADGYMSSAGFPYGTNRQGGGNAGGSGQSAGNKFVMGSRGGNMGFAFYELSDVGATFQDYTYNVVSSSTSVVKYGNCTTDSTSSRWSAAGVNLQDPSGQARIVLVSSTTSGTTTAAALCPIFKAMNITNALRMDGGPSAGITMYGRLLNPLEGIYRLKYGDARNIAYGLSLRAN